MVDSGANKHEAARSREASPDVADSALQAYVTELREFFVEPERHAPRDIARVDIHRRERPVRRCDARDRRTAGKSVGETATATTPAAAASTAATAGRRC